MADETLAGIEAELRAVQYSATEDDDDDDDEDAAEKVEDWWWRNFAHKYPLYEYDAEKEQVVRRDKEEIQKDSARNARRN